MKSLIGALVFAVVGLMMLWGAWHVTKDTRHFLGTALRTTGRVVDFKIVESHKDDSSKHTVAHYPIIRFVTREKRVITFTSDSSVDPLQYSEGEPIKILYDKSKPHHARIAYFGSLWGTSLVLAILGFIFLGGGVLTYFLLYRSVRVNSAIFIGAGLLVTSVLMFWGLFAFGSSSLVVLRKGIQTTGVVVSLGGAPLIEYHTVEGKLYRYQSHITSEPPRYYTGDRVSIIYNPAKPYQAKIQSFSELWLVPSLFGGFGITFLGALIWLVVYKLRS